jgi:CheY-like chemotaxis protein
MDTPPDILVADDEIEIVAFISELLTDAGYSVRTVPDGASALREIQRCPPALVLLDNAMPGMTGAEVLRQLRKDGFRQMPVIMMSAHTRAEVSLKLGADFLSKPFSLDDLLSHVAQHIPFSEHVA